MGNWRKIRAQLLPIIFGLNFALTLANAADEERVEFSLDQGTLVEVLLALSDQADIQLIIVSDTVKQSTSPGLVGEYTAAEALSILLHELDTELTFTGDQTVIISDIATEQMPESYTETSSSTEDLIEEMLVTGTHIPTSKSYHSYPTRIVDAQSLSDNKIAIDDVAFSLLENQGSETLPNIFNQNFSAGTASINLRGIGLSSTLILFNGRRSVLSGAFAHDGSTFVDINSLPLAMIERVEFLYDGGAAIYGSDAIAGVANLITYKEYDGLSVTVSHQLTDNNDQSESHVSILYGSKLLEGKSNFVFGANFFNRKPLNANDRDFTRLTGLSSAGQPGNFVSPDSPETPITPDPECSVAGGILSEEQVCLFDFIEFAQLIVPEERRQAMLMFDYDISDASHFYLEALSSFNRVNGQTIPASLPTNGGIIPATHPFTPFTEEVVFEGRPFGANYPAAEIDRKNNTHRFVSGLNHDFSPTWSLDLSYQYSNNTYSFNFPDVRKSRFFAALQGAGGPTNDEFFNPFGFALGNSQEVIADISTEQFRVAENSLHSFELKTVGDLSTKSYSNVSLALGIQLRHESTDVQFDEDSKNFDLSYLKGGIDYSGSRSVISSFAELAADLSPDIDVQLTGRYEHYEGFGSSFDPKASGQWRFTDQFTLRGSASSAFRVPSLHQTLGFQTGLTEYIDPSTGRRIFAGDLTRGNPNLENESAVTTNLGFQYRPIDGLEITLDGWTIDYKNIITKQNAQQFFEEWIGDGSPVNDILPSSLIDQDQSEVFTVNGLFDGVVTQFFNTASLKTGGIDVGFKYKTRWGSGVLNIDGRANRLLYLDIRQTESDPDVSALGRRNTNNFLRSNQRLRGELTFNWENSHHAIQLTSRYIGSYFDDERTTEKIDSYIQIDSYYAYDFVEDGLLLSIGTNNIFDAEPPRVDTNFGYDSQVYDPRGRLAYFRIKKDF